MGDGGTTAEPFPQLRPGPYGRSARPVTRISMNSVGGAAGDPAAPLLLLRGGQLRDQPKRGGELLELEVRAKVADRGVRAGLPRHVLYLDSRLT